MKKFRDNGAIGAILDEYEKSIVELEEVINDVTTEELTTIVDPVTEDADCRSIQTILAHVVGSGYGYAISIRNLQGEKNEWSRASNLDSVEAYKTALWEMFAYNEKIFADFPAIKMNEHETDKKILTRWGQRFDVEQLLEHAIVHVLRHRRQIERFLLKLRQENVSI